MRTENLTKYRVPVQKLRVRLCMHEGDSIYNEIVPNPKVIFYTLYNYISKKICYLSRSAGKPVFRYTSVTRATPLQLSTCSIQSSN